MDNYNYENDTLHQLIDEEATATDQGVTPPTDEQVIDNFSRQLRIKNVQLKLQTVNTALAESRANELKALTLIAQILGQRSFDPADRQEPDVEPDLREPPHTVTEEDIKNYSVLGSIKPGEQVFMSRVMEAQKYADSQKEQDVPQKEAEPENPVLERQPAPEVTEEKPAVSEPKQPERKLRKGK